MKRITWCVLCCLVAAPMVAGELTKDFRWGSPGLQSVGPLSFGPEGILFVADTRGAAIVAIDTGDEPSRGARAPFKVEALDKKIAAMVGSSGREILINDMVVNPRSGNAYVAASRGGGPDASPILLRVEKSGKITIVSLDKVKFSRAEIPDPPPAGVQGTGRRRRDPRNESITDLAYVDGQLIVAGLSNEEFVSSLRSIPFPFDKVNRGTSVEIFHGAHGRFETKSPVRTFVPFTIAGEPHLLAAYTCTPLVKISLASLKPGSHVKGHTVAELGNGNRPLDMIVYQKAGKDFLLMANTRRGVMKIPTSGLGEAGGITEKVARGERAGIPYETIEAWQGIKQLDRLDDKYALVLRQTESGSLDLEALPLP